MGYWDILEYPNILISWRGSADFFQNAKREIELIFFVRGMFFSKNLPPLGWVDFWKKNIAIRHVQFHVGQINFVPKFHCLFVNLPAADDKSLVFPIFETNFEGLINGTRNDKASADEEWVAGDDDIRPLRERPADALEAFPTHHDMVAKGTFFEPREVGGQVPRDLVVAADDPVSGLGSDGGNGHFLDIRVSISPKMLEIGAKLGIQICRSLQIPHFTEGRFSTESATFAAAKSVVYFFLKYELGFATFVPAGSDDLF